MTSNSLIKLANLSNIIRRCKHIYIYIFNQIFHQINSKQCHFVLYNLNIFSHHELLGDIKLNNNIYNVLLLMFAFFNDHMFNMSIYFTNNFDDIN